MNNESIIDLLQDELKRRREKNPSYSLRSFARDLDVDPSNLSKILARKKSPGKYLALKIGEKVGFTPEDQDWIFKSRAGSSKDELNEQDLEKFKVIAGWQHAAILELSRLRDFKLTVEGVAQKLGLTSGLVEESLRRLEQTGLLLRTAYGHLKANPEIKTADLQVTSSEPYRDQQREILEGALRALEKVSVERKSQTSLTIAIDSSRLEEAKLLIRQFRRQMARLMSDSASLDDVYHLSVSFYPVTQAAAD